ncbi:MAG: hypothetical protein EOO34_00135 [Cyanobacteriota bacterium]|nr:MAG: hypothetical protein EOO34_00135 [Cyanobacteriota bacterium]
MLGVKKSVFVLQQDLTKLCCANIFFENVNFYHCVTMISKFDVKMLEGHISPLFIFFLNQLLSLG